MQALRRSADGRVELVLGAGRLNKKAAALLLGGIVVTLLSTINPGSLQGAFEDLQCAVFQFDIAHGIATSTRGLTLQTKALNVLGGGALNLRSEEIELHFKTAKRKGLGISLLGIADSFIYITGTFRKPKAAIDLKGLLLSGGAAWATGGLSLLYNQLGKRLTAFSNPCDTVMRKGASHYLPLVTVLAFLTFSIVKSPKREGLGSLAFTLTLSLAHRTRGYFRAPQSEPIRTRSDLLRAARRNVGT